MRLAQLILVALAALLLAEISSDLMLRWGLARRLTLNWEQISADFNKGTLGPSLTNEQNQN